MKIHGHLNSLVDSSMNANTMTSGNIGKYETKIKTIYDHITTLDYSK